MTTKEFLFRIYGKWEEPHMGSTYSQGRVINVFVCGVLMAQIKTLRNLHSQIVFQAVLCEAKAIGNFQSILIAGDFTRRPARSLAQQRLFLRESRKSWRRPLLLET